MWNAWNIGVFLIAACAALCMGGCLVASSSKTVESGTPVGRATLSQIEPGQTDQGFILATLGPPTSKSILDDGTELWKWEYSRSRSSSGHVLLLGASSTRTETRSVTFVIFRDGIVERVWQD